jgi:hypothetical protein
MLEEAYPEAIVKSLGGVYPDTEIHTATRRGIDAVRKGLYQDATKGSSTTGSIPASRADQTRRKYQRQLPGAVSFGGVLVVMGINSDL